MDAPVKTKPYELAPVKGGRLPEHAKLLSAALQDMIDNLGPYVLASIGQTLVTIPVVFLGILGIYAVIGVGAVFGVGALVAISAAVGEEYAGLVLVFGQLAMFVAMFGVIFGLAGMMGGVLAPFYASVVRAVARHQRGEGKLEFGSAFSTLSENLVSVVLIEAGLAIGIGVGAMFCYVPGIALAFFTAFARPLVYLHGRPPMEAVTLAIRHTRDHLTWHAIWFALHFVVAMAASYIPFLGGAFLIALQVRAYREIFGDGEEPVLEIATE